MNFKNEYILLVVAIILIMPIQSSALGDAYAKIVYNVSALQDYQLHWNDRFPPNSTLMIYAEADDVNHKRKVGVDYVFIIKDSNNNIVSTSVYNSRYGDYRSNDFTTYSKHIDEGWEDGTYVAEIHVFDLLNDSIMDDYYKLLEKTLVNNKNYEDNLSRRRYYNDNCNYDYHYNYVDGYVYDNRYYDTSRCNATIPDVPYIDRADIIASADLMSHQYKKIVQTFYVDKYANKYPANRFMIENIALDSYNIAPGIPVQINTSVTNTFYDSGKVSMDLMLDDKIVGNFATDVGPYYSKYITLAVPKEITENMEYGNHRVGIIPTSDNTVGSDLFINFTITGMRIETPAKFVYNDLQTSKLAVKPNETIIVTVSVENSGRPGNQSIGLLINDVPIQEKTVFVNTSEKKDINFNVTEQELGEYRISINNTNLSKIFIVESNVTIIPPTKTQVAEKQIPKIFIVLVLSILLIMIYIIRKKFIAKGLWDNRDIEEKK